MQRYLYEQYQMPLHKMNVISYGEEKPVAPNKTKDGPRAEPPRGHQGARVAVRFAPGPGLTDVHVPREPGPGLLYLSLLHFYLLPFTFSH